MLPHFHVFSSDISVPIKEWGGHVLHGKEQTNKQINKWVHLSASWGKTDQEQGGNFEWDFSLTQKQQLSLLSKERNIQSFHGRI